MGKVHSDHVATYAIDGKIVMVDLCMTGEDVDGCDLFDEHGECLNLGEMMLPERDYTSEVPTCAEVDRFLYSLI